MVDALHRAGARARSLAARVLWGRGLAVLFVAVCALAYPLRYPLLKLWALPHESFASLSGYGALAAVALVAAGAALLALCWQAWRLALARPTRATALLIVGGWLGASFCLLLTYPGESTDLGDYIFRAHMLVHLGSNPLTTPPSAVIAWNDFPYLAWYDVPDSYGPLWQALSGAVHALAGEGLLANYLAYKVLATAAIGLSGWLIYALLVQEAPAYALAGLALWLWNPVVLNEGILQGHNDLVMLPIVLGALWLFGRRRAWPAGLAIVLLVAVGLFKANIWVLLPVALLWLVREGGGRSLPAIVLGLLAGAVLIWLAYLPFGGPERLREVLTARSWWPSGTWIAAVFFAVRDGLGWPHTAAVRWVIGPATALFGLLAAAVMLRVRGLHKALWAVTLAYLLAGSYWLQPWYATWLVLLAALVSDRRVATYTFLFSAFMLLHPVVAYFVAGRLALPPGGYHAVMAAATLLAPQLLALRLARNAWRSG